MNAHRKPQTCHGMLLEQGNYCRHVVISLNSVKYIYETLKQQHKSNLNRSQAWEEVSPWVLVSVWGITWKRSSLSRQITHNHLPHKAAALWHRSLLTREDRWKERQTDKEQGRFRERKREGNKDWNKRRRRHYHSRHQPHSRCAACLGLWKSGVWPCSPQA